MESPIISEPDIAYVCETARTAGQLAAAMRSEVSVRLKSDHPLDMVTEADSALSDIIVKRLKARFPDDAIIFEEVSAIPAQLEGQRMWFVDPIDGTENYVANDGQYSVMIGLVQDGEPIFGWIYAPAMDETYFGGPSHGAWIIRGTAAAEPLKLVNKFKHGQAPRLMMGNRDRESHPWVNDFSGITWVHSGSVGLRVARLINGEADIYAHLAGKLKVWDTAGPVALARAGGLDVGSLDGQELQFILPNLTHQHSLVIGAPGTLSWTRANFRSSKQSVV